MFGEHGHGYGPGVGDQYRLLAGVLINLLILRQFIDRNIKLGTDGLHDLRDQLDGINRHFGWVYHKSEAGGFLPPPWVWIRTGSRPSRSLGLRQVWA